ncbi:ComEA family DNA-binding protein [Halomonas sp. V046]|uniref:ComEA family DNA-binding protein n=1 Tax=Halomonas sp. V046 TaxID=3459611 RepID=UPI0040447BD0
MIPSALLSVSSVNRTAAPYSLAPPAQPRQGVIEGAVQGAMQSAVQSGVRRVMPLMLALWLGASLPALAADAPQITPINVNQASVELLTELPGIGPGKAQAIVDDRTANGPFSGSDDLTRVKGIGDSTVANLRDEISF